MDKVKVLVTVAALRDEHLRRISGVSEKVEVEKRIYRKRVLEDVKNAEVLMGWMFDKEIFHAAKRLKWFHAASTGVDTFLFPEFVESQVILTNSSGIASVPMSEMAMTFILCFAKKIPRLMRLKTDKRWIRHGTFRGVEELAGKTLGVLGLGNVGMQVAWRAKWFDMRVIAVERSAIRKPIYVDEILGVEDLDLLLAESDYFVITVPLTSETRHMIGEKQLKLMKSNAYLINVSRGGVVDEKALVKALREGWIAGAGLDVFEKEPLPEESELWDLENVIITPHVSGSTPHYAERLTALFCKNLKRYIEGRPLINVVNKRAGY
jgi:phosphoglycerate dehydrogenase-like enzyme